MAVLYLSWAVLGLVVVVTAALTPWSRRAYPLSIAVLAVLMLGAGAAVNVAFLLTDASYTGFADGSASQFVTDTWESLVVANQWFFISLLVAFETTVGVLLLLGGRRREVALWLIAAFHVALLSFGWAYALWSGPMVVAMLLLVRAHRRRAPAEPAPRAALGV